jgi:hypothetical protein
MTARLRRTARAVARLVTRASTDWQCEECSQWFTSETPSQRCPNCA